MDNAPVEAPSPAPAEPSVETPTNNEPAAAPAQPQIDMHGFSQEDLAGMRRFIDNNGGWDAIKQKISAPKSVQQEPIAQPPQDAQYGPQMQQQPTSQTYQQPQQAPYRPPQGAITAEEFLAQQYFQGLSRDPKYEGISEQIASGEVLKEMAGFNIKPLNQDGSINDAMVRRYLDLKAQTVPAKPTESEPNASSAPTVTYTGVGEGGIKSMDEAYKIIMEPGNPNSKAAEDFIKNSFNKK